LTGPGDSRAVARIVARDTAIRSAAGLTLHAICVASALSVNTNWTRGNCIWRAGANPSYALAFRSATSPKHTGATLAAAETRNTREISGPCALHSICWPCSCLTDYTRALRAALTVNAGCCRWTRVGTATADASNAGGSKSCRRSPARPEDARAGPKPGVGICRCAETRDTRKVPATVTHDPIGPTRSCLSGNTRTCSAALTVDTGRV
jgi:hypothetical protein